MVSPLKLLVSLITVLATASPVSVQPRTLTTVTRAPRADDYIKIKCMTPGETNRHYTGTQQQFAVAELTRFANVADGNKPKSWDSARYPHKYKPKLLDENGLAKSPAVDYKLEKIPECKTGQRGKTWLLYPILKGGKQFSNGLHAGPDRVLVVADGVQGRYRNFVYCGALSHTNDRFVTNGFDNCWDDELGV